MRLPERAGAGRGGRARAGGHGVAQTVVDLARAPERSERDALGELISAYLPLAYNIVGWALNGYPDSDDGVRAVMVSALRAGDPRDDAAFRSRLLTACVRQVKDSWQAVGRRPGPAMSRPGARPEPDFARRTVEWLGLTGERREMAEAARWLSEEDTLLLALWWQEATGALRRGELAGALGLSDAEAAEAVARLVRRVDVCRAVQRALRREPDCQGFAIAVAGWDGAPDPAWRDRLAVHVLGCPSCQPGRDEMTPAAWLLEGLPLSPPPSGLARAVARSVLGEAARPEAARPEAASRHGAPRAGSARRPAPEASVRRSPVDGVLGRLGWHPSRSTLAVISAAVALVLVGGIVTVLRGPGSSTSASGIPVGDGTQLVTTGPSSQPALAVAGAASSPSATTPASATKTPASQAAPPMAFSLAVQKGVCVSIGAGVNSALAASGTSWYYNWMPAPSGIATPPGVAFVPMIKTAADLTPAVLDEVKHEGHYLLGFNEPDHPDGANLTVSQALALWPKLEATGMDLGSPAISYGTNSTTSWLGQFMQGAKARGYRVDFVTMHWYGQHHWNDTAANVAELKRYLTQTYELWGKPIWLTEFALIDFQDGPKELFPTGAQQAAFLTAATKMLSTLHFVHRYAWYALSASGTYKGTAALYDGSAVASSAGIAFKNVP